jgi:glutathione S-transferase
MKLYYSPGTCSLSPHIIAREAGIPLDLVRVDIRTTPHRTEDGADYAATVTAKGYVPVLELDDGSLLTEGVAIVQYLADQVPATGLAPPHDSIKRYRLMEWLTFISSELHKMFSPWLFHPEYGKTAADTAKARIGERLAFIDRHLTDGPYLLGATFTVADAYLFTIVGWCRVVALDLAPYPRLVAHMDRIAARPAVRKAMRAEGLLRDAA